MDKLFEATIFNRNVLVGLLDQYSNDQLNKIPKGFNNSMIWNIGHVLVTEQLLIYKLSGLSLTIDNDLVSIFGKGSKPERDISQSQIDYIKENLITTVLQTQNDYKKGIFKTFQSYPTSTGVVLNSMEDSLQFNCFHEGIHLGILMAMKKLV